MAWFVAVDSVEQWTYAIFLERLYGLILEILRTPGECALYFTYG